MNKILPFCAVPLAFLCGCASIVSKSTWPVTISSPKPGAKITIYNRAGIPVQTGEAPMTVALDASSGYFRSEQYRIEMQCKGYPMQITTLNAHVNPWFWGNIVFGGLIGILVVDPLTGAMWKLPNTYTVPLPYKAASVKPGTVTIAKIDDIPGDLRSKLVRVN